MKNYILKNYLRTIINMLQFTVNFLKGTIFRCELQKLERQKTRN